VFLGHFALGFAAKRVTPGLSLAALFLAAQFADFLWPILVALGIERVRIDPGNTAVTPLDFVSYPYSHSLAMLVVWGVLLGLVYRRFVPQPLVFGVTLALVVSHWVLDFVTHRPDLPLYPGGLKVGLGLWSSIAATVAVEAVLYGAGLWIYMRCTRARGGVGRWGFYLLAVLLAAAYAANFGPPPPSVTALYATAIGAAALIVLWSWWFDRRRQGAA